MSDTDLEQATKTDESELEQLKKRRADARARKDAAAQSRELLHAREAAEREEREADATAAMAELEAKYGPEGRDLAKFTSPHGMIVVRRLPSHGGRAKWTKFVRTKRTDVDQENFVRPHVVFPSLDEYDRILEEQAAAVQMLANALCKLYGVREEEDEGK
jgi:hypothetical protein